MYKKDVVEYFGSEAEVARILGITRAAVNRWPLVVPIRRQYEIREKTQLDFNNKELNRNN